MLGYIIIGVFVLIFASLAVLYFINSKKIKKASKAKAKKDDASKKPDEKAEKVEVKSEVIKGNPVENAIKSANAEQEMEEAFRRIDEQKKLYDLEVSLKASQKTGRLQVDRGDFKTDLQKTLEQNTISSQTNKLESETRQMGHEGPDAIASQDQISSNDKQQTLQQDKIVSISQEIENLSPELKAILIDNLLDKKY